MDASTDDVSIWETDAIGNRTGETFTFSAWENRNSEYDNPAFKYLTEIAKKYNPSPSELV